MINQLKILGNEEASVLISQGKGVRLDGRKHPHSWSIMEADDCMGWMLECLKTPKVEAATQWNYENYRTRKVGNISFTLPVGSFADKNRERYLKETLKAVGMNAHLMQIGEYTDPIRIYFYESKEAMGEELFYVSSGWANPQYQAAYMVANETSEPPLQHELMHLMCITKCGWPAQSATWMNEGLATYAPNDCNNYTVDQIYRYLLDADLLIPLADLANDFYQHAEMIAYHQSAYIVEYLIKIYGLEKFKQLWKEGFEAFETIYGSPYPAVEKALQQAIVEKYPKAPKIDWERFEKGCQ